jgi:sugar lactone lactonase YvrE
MVLLKPSFAWMVVFVPALSYFVTTRLSGLFFPSSVGQPLPSAITLLNNKQNCSDIEQILYVRSPCQHTHLLHELYVVVNTGLYNLSASTWRHDSDLGRGYLLVSDAYGSGRIWRWEVGGGPIPIGKTLHVEQSGCRSRENNCKGSGGLAIDFKKQQHASEGTLMVAEWGEERIVRLEENGVRTPLVLHVPSICDMTTTATTRRVQQPHVLLMTALGDLWFVDTSSDCQGAGLYSLKEGAQVKPLGSLQESRLAHEWDSVEHALPKLVYTSHAIGGIALTTDWTSLYFTTLDNNLHVLLMRISIVADNEEQTEHHPVVVLDLSSQYTGAKVPGSLAVDKLGNIYTTTPDGILVISNEKELLAKIDAPRLTSLTLGEDGFLYGVSAHQILRLRVKHGPIKLPTNTIR